MLDYAKISDFGVLLTQYILISSQQSHVNDNMLKCI